MGPVKYQTGGFDFQLLSGAGNCVINSGTLTGTGHVTIDPSNKKIQIDLYTTRLVSQFHAWVGTGVVYKSGSNYITAPGQLPYVDSSVSLPYQFTYGQSHLSAGESTFSSWNSATDIYIMVHAETATC
eukprot:TRINITY_DN402_c0_g1_i4.p1 TRINITY_DN402_c0_g1~~TRINITY_DN402_c0_g1_i4.p1  ORF type:complete len:128 (+),score=28.24 TRINITY_DN402_c0_g1_i4:678-1061(+)